ncbi:glycosyltransferase, partial [Metallosphaera sedula]|uniref:glycosyltransferase n=1 Tax=Metallosphaera prunae TaxID=47304 RepID=UPI0030B8FCAE
MTRLWTHIMEVKLSLYTQSLSDNYMVFISVIITAHNRKEYLMQAVDSALNQTLPKTEYEVIVVKNFEDYDEELEKKGVKSIVTSEKELGEKIVIGTKEA